VKKLSLIICFIFCCFKTYSQTAQVNKSLNGLSVSLKSTAIKFDADYQAVLNRGNALGYKLPTYAQRVKQNNVVKQLKSNGIWQKLDIFYMFATNGDVNFSTLNWKNPLLYQGTRVASPSFVINKGAKGDGMGAYINTNYNAATNGVQYTLNSCSRGAWVYDNTGTSTANACIDGVMGNTENCFFGISATAHRINQGTNNLPANVDMSGVGFKMITRSNANTVVMQNENSRSVNTIASTAISSASQTILNRAIGVSPTPSILGVSSYWMGGDLDSQRIVFRTILLNYLNSL